MNANPNPYISDLDALEGIVDRNGLRRAVQMLSRIASEKAAHIRVNWQDHVTDKPWDRDARKLDRFSLKIENDK